MGRQNSQRLHRPHRRRSFPRGIPGLQSHSWPPSSVTSPSLSLHPCPLRRRPTPAWTSRAMRHGGRLHISLLPAPSSPSPRLFRPYRVLARPGRGPSRPAAISSTHVGPETKKRATTLHSTSHPSQIGSRDHATVPSPTPAAAAANHQQPQGAEPAQSLARPTHVSSIVALLSFLGPKDQKMLQLVSQWLG